MRLIFVATSTLLLAHSATAHAGSFTFEGAAQTDDTTILQGFANDSFGAAPNLDVGRNTPSDRRRSLLRFDVSALAGETVTGATLRLTLVSATSNNFGGNFGANVALHAIVPPNADWTEGAAVNTAGPDAGFATWSQKAEGAASWVGGGGLGSPGAGYAASPTATFLSLKSDGVGTQYAIPLTDLALVQGWVDSPAMNAGLLLRADTLENHPSFNLLLRYGQSERSDAAERPSLTIHTSGPVPEPASSALFALGLVAVVGRRRHRRG